MPYYTRILFQIAQAVPEGEMLWQLLPEMFSGRCGFVRAVEVSVMFFFMIKPVWNIFSELHLNVPWSVPRRKEVHSASSGFVPSVLKGMEPLNQC